jgi:hypothetical protein
VFLAFFSMQIGNDEAFPLQPAFAAVVDQKESGILMNWPANVNPCEGPPEAGTLIAANLH